MQYGFTHRRYYFFVYVVPDGDELHLELPHGGITARGESAMVAYDTAWLVANERFARRPGELLVLVEKRDRVGKLQARLLELDKQRADNKFRLEMMV